MKKDSLFFIQHILENIQDIEIFMDGVARAEFFGDKEKQNAVISSLEIIGEAVKMLPSTLTERYPGIPWKEIAGTRDKIIHQYFSVDLDIIWDIAKGDLPKLKKQIEKIKA